MLLEDDLLDFTLLKFQIEDMVDKSEMREMLKIQLLEFEMLESMFSIPGEFEVYDPYAIGLVKDFIKGVSNVAPPRIDFTVNLRVDGKTFEICVALPVNYPLEEPEIFVRSDSLTKVQQRELNEDLSKYITSLVGEISIYPAVAWLQENALSYLLPPKTVSRSRRGIQTKNRRVDPKPVPRNVDTTMICSRYWTYSHYIHNKMKGKCILELAEACNVTGFFLSGRPAIICVEGWKSDCDDWWRRVHQMNWKGIVRKRVDEAVVTNEEELKNFRKFRDFQEIHFTANIRHKFWRHTDMGEFQKYLCSHDCGHVFRDFFGVDGSMT